MRGYIVNHVSLITLLLKWPSRNHISVWANCLIFEESCNLVAQEIIKTCKQGNGKNRCLKGSIDVYDCARTRLTVWVDLVSVWSSLCASSFDSQNAAWNMAAALAIMSLGKTIQLNSFDPAKIKSVGKVHRVLSHNMRRRQNKAKEAHQTQNKNVSVGSYYCQEHENVSVKCK